MCPSHHQGTKHLLTRAGCQVGGLGDLRLVTGGWRSHRSLPRELVSYRSCYPLALGPQGLNKRWLLRSRASEGPRGELSPVFSSHLDSIDHGKCLSHPYTVPCTHPYCVLFGPLLPFLPSPPPPLLHFKLLGPFCLHSFFHLAKSPRCDLQTDLL